MSVEDHTVSFSLELNVAEAERNLRRLQTVLFRSLSLASRLTGDENLRRGIQTVQEMIVMANRLRLALLALQAARMAAGDPLAWAMAGLAVAEFGVAVGGASLYEVGGR